jgi:hypothetical protein
MMTAEHDAADHRSRKAHLKTGGGTMDAEGVFST